MSQEKTSRHDKWLRFTKWLPLSESIVIADIEVGPQEVERWRIHFDRQGIPVKIEIQDKGMFRKQAIYIQVKRGRHAKQSERNFQCQGSQEDL